MLLGMSREKIIEADEEEMHSNLDDINKKFKDLQFSFQFTTSRNETRGRTFIENTIMACLPPKSSSTTFHSSEERSSSLQIHKELQADMPMFESQKSTSKIQEEHLPTNPIEHQISSTGKRSLDSEEDLTLKGLKHAKQD